jgi:hypothetical protein
VRWRSRKEDYSLVGLSGLLAERPTAENYPGAWFYATDVAMWFSNTLSGSRAPTVRFGTTRKWSRTPTYYRSGLIPPAQRRIMACQQESTGNEATEIAPIVTDAAQQAVRSSIAIGEAFCYVAGSCSGSGESCSYTVTSGSVTIVPISTGDGSAYSATATTNGKCECKTAAPGTPGT